MNPEMMTEALQQILNAAVTKAQQNHNSEIAPEHILDAIVEDDGVDGIWQRLHEPNNRKVSESNRLCRCDDGGED